MRRGGSRNTANRVGVKRWGVPIGGSVSGSEKRGSKPNMTVEVLFTRACLERRCYSVDFPLWNLHFVTFLNRLVKFDKWSLSLKVGQIWYCRL